MQSSCQVQSLWPYDGSTCELTALHAVTYCLLANKISKIKVKLTLSNPVLSRPHPGCGLPREASSPCCRCSQEGCSRSLWWTSMTCRCRGQCGSLPGPCQGNQDPWMLEIYLPFPFWMPDKNRKVLIFEKENLNYLSSVCWPFEIKFQMHLYSRRKNVFHNHKFDILRTSLKSNKDYLKNWNCVCILCVCTW